MGVLQKLMHSFTPISFSLGFLHSLDFWIFVFNVLVQRIGSWVTCLSDGYNTCSFQNTVWGPSLGLALPSRVISECRKEFLPVFLKKYSLLALEAGEPSNYLCVLFSLRCCDTMVMSY